MEFEKILEMALPRIAFRLQTELMLKAPVDKGRLKNSIKVVPYGQGVIISLVDYAKFVEFGTNPHIIKPKNKKALKFKIGSKNVFAGAVKHPRTRPNPFIKTTLKQKLQRIIIEEIQRIIKILDR